MRENTVKSIWKRGGAAVNGWMGIPSSVAAEGMAPGAMREGKVTGAESAGGSMY